MPDVQPDQTLHLPSLVIKNFRGIDELTIPRLGRVTLLAGKNGVGKTTVLDAVRVWAGRGRISVIDQMLHNHGDSFTPETDGERRITADRNALFTNQSGTQGTAISIGPRNETNTLNILQIPQDGVEPNDPNWLVSAAQDLIELKVQFGVERCASAATSEEAPPLPDSAICNALGPNAPTDKAIEQLWNRVALTVHEDLAVEALNLATDGVVERVALVDATANSGTTHRRQIMAKVESKNYPVPLRTLGDGALRTYAVALALAKSTNGFLLIDEAENGIHHTIQPKFWKMVLQTAKRNNVQVLATTHSWDCVKGFAQASAELEDVEGVLYRLEKHEDSLRAVEYSEKNLKAAAKYGIEVR